MRDVFHIVAMPDANKSLRQQWTHRSRSWSEIVLLPLLLPLVLLLSSCYSMRPSAGGGQTTFKPPRQYDAEHIAVPQGYQVELIAKDLTFPTGIAFDDRDQCYVVESGYSYGEIWTTPRLLRINANGTSTTVASGTTNGPWNGVAHHNGKFYVAEGGVAAGGRLLQITFDGNITVLVSNLPSMGDHHSNGPVVGSDGSIYLGQGTVSNSGVVGEDNAEFGWLHRHPTLHDIPGADVRLAGQNFDSKNPLAGTSKTLVRTGAFAPFGSESGGGQIISGHVPCSGSVLRIKPGAGDIELVAWGFRNPFGLGFANDGRLFVTENGFDDRGSRPIWGAPDVLWEVKPGEWYGWPDYAGGMPVTNRWFKPPGKQQPRFLLASHPSPPPKPAALLGVHSSANGLDFSRSSSFGHQGEAFIALFGDQSPVVGKVLQPVGFKVVRVDIRTGVIESFATNKGKKNGPASYIGGRGFERPIAVRFNSRGDALYVLDFGVMLQTRHKSHPVTNTGALWRIVRQTSP